MQSLPRSRKGSVSSAQSSLTKRFRSSSAFHGRNRYGSRCPQASEQAVFVTRTYAKERDVASIQRSARRSATTATTSTVGRHSTASSSGTASVTSSLRTPQNSSRNVRQGDRGIPPTAATRTRARGGAEKDPTGAIGSTRSHKACVPTTAFLPSSMRGCDGRASAVPDGHPSVPAFLHHGQQTKKRSREDDFDEEPESEKRNRYLPSKVVDVERAQARAGDSAFANAAALTNRVWSRPSLQSHRPQEDEGTTLTYGGLPFQMRPGANDFALRRVSPQPIGGRASRRGRAHVNNRRNHISRLGHEARRDCSAQQSANLLETDTEASSPDRSARPDDRDTRDWRPSLDNAFGSMSHDPCIKEEDEEDMISPAPSPWRYPDYSAL